MFPVAQIAWALHPSTESFLLSLCLTTSSLWCYARLITYRQAICSLHSHRSWSINALSVILSILPMFRQPTRNGIEVPWWFCHVFMIDGGISFHRDRASSYEVRVPRHEYAQRWKAIAEIIRQVAISSLPVLFSFPCPIERLTPNSHASVMILHVPHVYFPDSLHREIEMRLGTD